MNKTFLVKAAVFISALTLLSRVLGFVREMVFAAVYGISSLMDAYVVANMMPSVLGTLVQGGIITAFMPVYNSYLARKEELQAKVLLSSVFCSIIVLALIVCGLGFFLVPWLVPLFAPGFTQEGQLLTISLTRVMLPIMLLSGILGVLIAVQQSHNKFTFPALNGLPANIVLISGVALFAAKYGIYAVAIASTCALVAQVVLQYIGIRKAGLHFKQIFDYKHPGLRKIGKLIIPVMLGLAATQVNLFVDRILASGLPSGSIAALTYASKINDVFIGLFSVSIITVVFPNISKYAAVDDWGSVKAYVNFGVRILSFILIPISGVMIIFNQPIVALMLQRGSFDTNATQITAIALQCFAFGLLSMSLLDFLNRIFYAQQDTRTPVIVTLTTVTLNIIFNLILVKPLAHGGLALATSIATTAGVGMLFYLLNRKLGSYGGKKIVMSIGKTLAATFAMLLAAYFLYGILLDTIVYGMINTFISNLIVLFLANVVGLLVFIGIAYYVKSEELRFIVDIILKK